MPKHFEFVFAAYGIWIAVFGCYLIHLFRKSRIARRALERLGAGERQEG
jgi:hypothetical protein